MLVRTIVLGELFSLTFSYQTKRRVRSVGSGQRIVRALLIFRDCQTLIAFTIKTDRLDLWLGKLNQKFIYITKKDAMYRAAKAFKQN